jgi:hypothetical protein
VSNSIVFGLISSDNFNLVTDVKREIFDITATEIHTDTTTKREFVIFMIYRISLISETRESFIISEGKGSESSEFICLPDETITCSFTRLQMLE